MLFREIKAFDFAVREIKDYAQFEIISIALAEEPFKELLHIAIGIPVFVSLLI